MDTRAISLLTGLSIGIVISISIQSIRLDRSAGSDTEARNGGNNIVSALKSVIAAIFARSHKDAKDSSSVSCNQNIKNGVECLIGNTPLMKIKSLSEATGCEIWAKMELMNPGGSAKDRVALAIVEEAEKMGLIKPDRGDTIYEGTSGSTGISLAMVCRSKGYKAYICLPDDTSTEKIDLLEKLGAAVEKVRPASIVDKKQYVNMARMRADSHNESSTDGSRGVFANQFENEANWKTHYMNTGPEIFEQTGGFLDAFITGSGTGGTISGISLYLKSILPNLKVVLADPPGSGLYNKVKFGVMFDIKEREGTRRRHQVDTLVEGIGLNRLTKNFDAGYRLVDDAVKVTDEESLFMAKYLVANDGLFVGSSSAVNCVAAVKYARKLGPGHNIVTIICDSGARHLSKFWKAVGAIDTDKSLMSLEKIMSI
ncbi:tryptophan synthase beta subunit-like PLP-dependent enzyme [Dipodascopsis uninucleata]